MNGPELHNVLNLIHVAVTNRLNSIYREMLYNEIPYITYFLTPEARGSLGFDSRRNSAEPLSDTEEKYCKYITALYDITAKKQNNDAGILTALRWLRYVTSLHRSENLGRMNLLYLRFPEADDLMTFFATPTLGSFRDYISLIEVHDVVYLPLLDDSIFIQVG